MSLPSIIVVQGSPAVGKTTIARKLAGDLGIGVIGKDDIKELLYDRMGLPENRDVSRVYGTVTMAMLFMIADQMTGLGKSFIIESAFHKEFAEADLKILQSKHNVKIMQVFCYADPQTQLDRYNARIKDGTRHKGHPDNLDKTIDVFIEYQASYQKLNIDPTFELDTTDFERLNYETLLRDVSAFLLEVD